MQAKRLRNAIVKRGGSAAIKLREHMRPDPLTGTVPQHWELSGELNGYDVHMFLCNGGQPADGGNSYYTVRRISMRGHHDPCSDYNPGGWTFCNRIADLDWAVR
jgi:hypothetical protein